MHRVHLLIHGRVQGVGYRYFVLRRAQELNLTGWVRNLADGSVETEADGDRAGLERFRDRLTKGPAAARVDRVLERWSETAVAHERFVIRADGASP